MVAGNWHDVVHPRIVCRRPFAGRLAGLPQRCLLIFSCVVGSTWCPGCNRTRVDSLTLFVSGDTTGWITPCGCAANQSGGLARRATLVAEAGEAERVIYADA